MNHLKEKTFNAIYNIFYDNKLIAVDENTDKRKKEAYESFSSSFESIQTSTLINNDLHTYADRILSTLNIDPMLKQKYNDIYKKVIDEIELLKYSINLHELQFKAQKEEMDEHLKKQDEKLQTLTNKIDLFEKNICLQDIKINSYELAYLFRIYYVDPTIKKIHQNKKITNWSQLTDEWSKREKTIKESFDLKKQQISESDIQKHPRIQQLLVPVERKLRNKLNYPFKLIDLRKICRERNAFAHNAPRSVEEQRWFFEELKKQKYPSDYEYAGVVNEMLNCVCLLDVDRDNTGLSGVH